MKIKFNFVPMCLCVICFLSSCNRNEYKISGVNVSLGYFIDLFEDDELTLDAGYIDTHEEFNYGAFNEICIKNATIKTDCREFIKEIKDARTDSTFCFPECCNKGYCEIYNKNGELLLRYLFDEDKKIISRITSYAKLYIEYAGLSQNPIIADFTGEFWCWNDVMMREYGTLKEYRITQSNEPYLYRESIWIPCPYSRESWYEEHEGLTNCTCVIKMFYPNGNVKEYRRYDEQGRLSYRGRW